MAYLVSIMIIFWQYHLALYAVVINLIYSTLFMLHTKFRYCTKICSNLGLSCTLLMCSDIIREFNCITWGYTVSMALGLSQNFCNATAETEVITNLNVI